MAGALLPLALMFGGYMANEQAKKKVSRARDGRLREEMDRQGALGAEADARLKGSLAEQERPAIEQDQRVAEASRAQKYEAAALPSEGYTTSPSAPSEVKSEAAARMVDALRRGRQQSKALAKLGGGADAQTQSQIHLGRSAQDLNRIGGMSRASSAILPYELQGANAAGEQWSTIADLFNLASTGAGLYGMTTAPAVGAYGSTGAARNVYMP